MGLRLISLTMMLAVLASCASSPRGGSGGGPDRRPQSVSVNQPSLLLTKARAQQAEQGCAKAAPAYRVVAGFGAGYEVAQYELGACLLEMASAGTAEAELFSMESLFWLNRAAWAGNPRAQGKLAEMLSGAGGVHDGGLRADPETALMWVMVYDANGARELYNLPDIPVSVMTHLGGVLTPAMQKTASARAGAFRKIEMAVFTPPAGARQQGQGGQGRGRPEGGGRGEGRRKPR